MHSLQCWRIIPRAARNKIQFPTIPVRRFLKLGFIPFCAEYTCNNGTCTRQDTNNNIRQYFELRIKTTEAEQEVGGVLKGTVFITGVK